MNPQIRKFGLALLVMFGALFIQLNYLQVVRSDKLANAPGNSRNAIRDFGKPRGKIITADGRVIAESYKNPATNSEYENLRRYPGGSLYGHITGYFSFTYGSTGIERQYNSVLAGRTTALTVRSLTDLLKSKTVTADVKLTINNELQQFAARALRKRAGSIVVTDPRNGAILAAVSYPPFDPNRLAGTNFPAIREAFNELNADPAKPMLARSYRERYPPGSTMKVVTTAAGLDTQVAGPQTLYPVLRSLPLRFTKRQLRNFGGGACGGELASAFRVSCNTSFAQLGLDLGGAKLAASANGFGFNRKPPLDISPGAAASSFPAPDYFIRNDPQLAQAAIGQGQVSATTLEMALVAAGIANGGVIKAPHFMAEVRDSEGAVIETASNNDWLKATSPETAAQITKMMVDVVRAGTGTRAAIKGVEVAAKTGTAQTGRGTAHAWTIGFAPAETPGLAIAVIIESQPDQGASTGGKVAAPVAREVLTKALGIFG